MNVGRKLAAAAAVAAVTVALAPVGLVTPAVLAQASPATSAHAAFCASWARFGDTPSYRNLTAVHRAAEAGQEAGKGTSWGRAYLRFESDLLAGYPTRVIRKDSGAVWRDCGH